MKPIVLFYEKTKDGKIVMSEEEVKELIDNAYRQGFEDGKKAIPQQPKKVEIPKFSSLGIIC
jgi:hypothetical protein